MHKVRRLPRKSSCRCTKCCACHAKVAPDEVLRLPRKCSRGPPATKRAPRSSRETNLQARTFQNLTPAHLFLSCGQISEGTSPTCSEGCYFLSPGQNGTSSHMIWHQSIQTGIQIEMFRPILYVYFCRCIHDISMQIFLTPIASTNYTSIARVGNNNCLAHSSGSKCWPFISA